MKSKDSLGDRMKRYEVVTSSKLMPRSYAIIRIDGKAFHTYTKGFDKPWDSQITKSMEQTMKYLCEKIQGVKYGFYQSDEISLVLTDFDNYETDAWFDNKIQKIVSVSASMTTAAFNWHMTWDIGSHSIDIEDMAMFDSRIWNVPNREEVLNYLIWRQQDTIKNSISMLAQTLYSTKQLEGKNGNERQEMCFKKGKNWNDVPTHLKRGTGCYKRKSLKMDNRNRTEWYLDYEVPIFSQDRDYFFDKILIQD